MRIAFLIVAAGKGIRAGGSVPKQYALLKGIPMLRRTIDAFAGYPDSRIQVMIGPGQEAQYQAATKGMQNVTLASPLCGGATRQDTVRIGLEALAAHRPDVVLIHDAARPMVSRKIIDGVLEALAKGADGAIPMQPVADTLRKQVDGQWVTVPRDGMFKAQTPQGFRFDTILAAHRRYADREVTDDMALGEMAGFHTVITPGDETNMKVTRPEDFAMAEHLLSETGGEFRFGSGYDVHKFCEGDHCWLCGISVPHDQGLLGHSDADVALHALTDAVLGAIADGDIGQHFPPSDEKWRGAPSWKFLDYAAKRVTERGGRIVNCDVTIICERPKVGPHCLEMRTRVAEILGIDVSRVSVKGTTTEGLGFTGRREGIAAMATACVCLP